MTDPTHIPVTPPSSSPKSTGGLGRSLPPVLRESLPRRLAIATLVYAGIYLLNVAAMVIETFVEDRIGLTEPHYWYYEIVGISSVALALAIFFLVRSRELSFNALQNLGMAFEILGTFAIALGSISPKFAPLDQGYFMGIPWTCVWLIAHPLMVPNTPRRAIMGGLLATATVPLAIYVNYLGFSHLGIPLPPAEVFAGAIFSNLLCAMFGVLGSVHLNDLGRQVQRARQMGSYRLVKRIAVGGMGEVWVGKHGLISRPAAVKLILPEALGSSNSETLIRRFEREAQATARLKSPHSIQLFDYGLTADGTFYYVMELLDGIDLETLVKRHGPLPSERVIHLLRHACHSLAEAHAAGLIHRDIKPANLYACRIGLDLDVLKVLDFGLVKDSLKNTQDSAALTGQITVGTPAYMAPEIARGEKGVDGRSDLYNLGCVAYWLLTGELVFQGDTAVQMLLAHVQDEPTPPSQRTELEVSPQLEALVMSCLAKSPDQRPASASELAEELNRCAEAWSWSKQEARSWWERHMPEPEDSNLLGGD